MSEDKVKDDPILGLALILMSIKKEKDPMRKGAFQFVFNGSLEKLGFSETEVRNYLKSNRKAVESLWRQRVKTRKSA